MRKDKAVPQPGLSARALRAADAPISALMRQALEQPGLISLAAGFVDPGSLPAEATRSAALSLLSEPELARAALQYGSTPGNTRLRRQLLERVLRADAADPLAPTARVDPPSEEQVVLTAGSNQVLALLADALLDPGDCVLCDAPTYFVFTGLIESVGGRCIAVPSDAGGMQMPALEAELERQVAAGTLGRVKAIYVMSYFDNPRGVSLAPERRAQLVALAERYSQGAQRIHVIEDAAYRELRFTGEDRASVRAHDATGETVVYAGTFSKSFAPGVRVGYAIMPPALASAVLSLKGNLDFGSPHLNQCLVSRALDLGLLEPHAAHLRELYARKAAVMLRALDEHVAPLGACRYQRPEGGLYVWLELPQHVDTSARSRLFLRARELGVLYVPGEHCYPAGSTRPSHAMRLSFGVQSEERIAEGIEKLSRAIREAL